MQTLRDANQRLKALASASGFKKRGNLCYRKKGDGILQFIKFEYEHSLFAYELRVGLLSLYSELRPFWLTPRGCILRYPVVAWTDGQRGNDRDLLALIEDWHDIFLPRPDEFNTQLEILQDIVMPRLDEMDTQRSLVDAMCEVEKAEYNGILWVDEFKIAPYLIDEDYASANFVIASILQQHVEPNSWTAESWTDADYREYSKRYPGKDIQLLRIHEWIKRGDLISINAYLQDNFIRNSAMI